MSDNVELMLGSETAPARVVTGHPMRREFVRDDDNTIKLNESGEKVMEINFGVAVPKGSETDWKQTEWGSQMAAVASQAYPQHVGGSRFSWKVTDGDSTEPNSNGNVPCQQEGWPGHWIVFCKTRMDVSCHYQGKYAPMERIQDENVIQCGDYCRVFVNVRANLVNGSPAKTPGIYVNPSLFELRLSGPNGQRGIKIIRAGSGPDAAAVFGGGQSAGRTPPPSSGRQAPPPAADNSGDLFLCQGEQQTRATLREWGWTDEQIETLDRVATPPPAKKMAPPPVKKAPPPAKGFSNGPAGEVRYNVEGTIYTESELRSAGYGDSDLANLPQV